MNDSPQMSHSGCMMGALAKGPVELSHPESPESTDQHEQLLDQAYWLGKCAELVYPPTSPVPVTEGKDDTSASMQPANGARWQAFLAPPNEKTPAEAENVVPNPYEPLWQVFFRTLEDREKSGETEPGLLETARTVFSENWPKEVDELQENDIDAMANKLHSAYRRSMRKKYLYPWRWFSNKRLRDMNQARQKWAVAHELWVQKAKARIEREITHWWSPKDSPRRADMKVDFFSCDGTECFVAGDQQAIILCFRGTQVEKWEDILTDLLAWQHEETSEDKQKAKLHAGFSDALERVWSELKQKLRDQFLDMAPDSQQKVWVTGHSLGGALATLAAYRLVREGVLTPDQIGGVFTFGQPRVGDPKFAENYTQSRKDDVYLTDRHFRFVNNDDLVTVVPPKSLSLIFAMLEPVWSLLPGSGGTKAPNTADKQAATGGGVRKTMQYGDVGRVVLADRADKVRVLTPVQSSGDFWWPLRLWRGRFGSYFKAMFRRLPPDYSTFGQRFTKRFLPGLIDHGMAGYIRVLEIEGVHRAFVRDAVKAIRDAGGNHRKSETDRLQAAEKAWAALKAKTTLDFVKLKKDQSLWKAAIQQEREGAITDACREFGK